jgi:hypothetical protein
MTCRSPGNECVALLDFWTNRRARRGSVALIGHFNQVEMEEGVIDLQIDGKHEMTGLLTIHSILDRKSRVPQDRENADDFDAFRYTFPFRDLA